ncbi:MAG TPA: hypothetical protein GX701_05085 [Clostridiales bacterium]|nr:hypothetical protein [Clostridiales bacterium]
MYLSAFSEDDCRRILRQNLKRFAFNDFYARQGRKGFIMRQNITAWTAIPSPLKKTVVGRFCGEVDRRVFIHLHVRNGFLWSKLGIFFAILFVFLWGASHTFMPI